MKTEFVFLTLAIISAVIMVWQFKVAVAFPLRRKIYAPASFPSITILKPLKGADNFTEDCLRSWLDQVYNGKLQFIFIVDSADDPSAKICEKLAKERPGLDVLILVNKMKHGSNSKISKLVTVEKEIKYDIVVVSDADVKASSDLLSSSAGLFSNQEIGLVCSFYYLANPENFAMKLEAVAINSDFWSQVLQARSIKPMNFALGAVMMIRRTALEKIGGFKSVVNKLADDYWLGRLISESGWKVEVSPMPVALYHQKSDLADVLSHQLRWARTIRVCEPVPYFFSVISNSTLWATLYFATASNSMTALLILGVILAMRTAFAVILSSKLVNKPPKIWNFCIPVIKDLAQAIIWALAFCGNRVKWRGKTYKVFKDGSMEEIK